ncbi:MAG: tripartite tricarboxylate transporter permease [Nanoarchaeota archaeon]
MFGEILIAALFGIAAGIVTGLTPGVHINLVSVLLLSSAAYLSKYVSLFALACFIISMGITHTFLDVLPSIFLGAPDEKTALGVLPGHRYLLKGKGYTAVKLSCIGAYFGLILSVILFPLFYIILKFLYPLLQDYMGWLLLLIALYMVLRDRKRLWAAYIFMLSGVFGLITFNIYPLKDPLFPMLSGLFGISTLIVSLNDKNRIPKQRITKSLKLDKSKLLQALLSGNFSAFFVSTFPGLSSSIAAVMSLQVTKKLGDYGFLVLLGAIGTAGFSLSLVALTALNKARNGPVIVIAQLLQTVTMTHIIYFLVISVIAGSIAFMLSLYLGRSFSSWITKVNYKLLVISIILFVTALVFFLTGWIGLIVLACSTAIGLIPAIVKTTRTQAMGCLMLPVIVYFLMA